jgi:hypothetical protein
VAKLADLDGAIAFEPAAFTGLMLFIEDLCF